MVGRALRALSGVALLVVALGAWTWHPVHAARVELVANGRDVTAVVRVYHDDFPPGLNRDAVAAYLSRSITLTDQQGVRVTLLPSAIVTEGDRVRITLDGTASGRVGQGRLSVTLLQERFSDQVNVALVRIDGRRAQLVYLKGDPAQALP
ncbi:MAG: hypothetical protein ABJC19_02435 [Gemmatimonadota bacterium]